MRYPVISIALVLWCQTAVAQNKVDLSKSIDPSTLTPEVLASQVDTSNQHRQSIGLSSLRSEFPTAAVVSVETFYQKSSEHMLLELSKGQVPLHKTFVISEGLGTTYWRISDGHCWVLLRFSTEERPKRQAINEDKGCLE